MPNPFDDQDMDADALQKLLAANPRDPQGTSANAPRMVQRGDQWVLTEHGNERPLQAGEVEGARGYTDEFWRKFPTGFQPDNPNSLNDAYQQFLGRQGDPEGLAAHQKNPGGFAGAIGAIAGSPEAKNYAALTPPPAGAPRPLTLPPGPLGPMTPAGTTSTTTAPFTPTAGARYDQWSGKGDVAPGGDLGRMEGFDQGNWTNAGMQTAKYQAGRIFSRFNPDDPNALQGIMGDTEFKKLFPNARSIGPDKIDFGDGKPVDMIRGHGAPGAKFAWQPEDGGQSRPPTSNTLPVTPLRPTTPAGTTLPVTPLRPTTPAGTTPPVTPPGRGAPPETDQPDSPMARIMAEIAALQQGESTPMDADALKRLLAGA